MNKFLRSFYGKTHQLSKLDWILLPAGLLLWAWSYFWLAPTIVKMQCFEDATQCQMESVPRIDQIALRTNNEFGHTLSDGTQNLSAYFALAVPVVAHVGMVALSSLQPATAFLRIGTDLVILAETTVWNGAFTFLVKTTVQRPRPYTYLDSSEKNANTQAYLSFYSGHTSFAASVNAGMLMLMAGYRISRRKLWFLTFVSVALVALTGYGRVLASVHFVTDVLFGAVAGMLVAYWIVGIHRKKF